MKKSFGYYIIMAFTWPMQLFPLEFHFIISDFLCFWVYRVFGYRKTVVRQNLINSFPQKSIDEIKKIEKDFYRGFIDVFLETLYMTHIDITKDTKRLQIENFETLQKLEEKGKSIVLVTGHFGNWEYMQFLTSKGVNKKFLVYKKLTNRAFDEYYRYIRGRAAQPLEMKKTFRALMTEYLNKVPFQAYFISDQRPIPEEIKHWVSFMNQDTPVMLGTEKIARKMEAAVLYAEISRVKRGYYKLSYDLLFEDSKATKPFEITDAFMKRLEKSINDNPEQYFWTHKRWKYKREDFN